MAYQFTFHAIKRCEDRGLEYNYARELFENAQKCKFKSKRRCFEKLSKYGSSQFSTEYWYKDGYLFVTQRKNRNFSSVLTVIPCKKKDLIIYEKENRKP